MFEKVYREKQTMLMSHKERFRKVEGVKKVLHWVVNFHIICGNLEKEIVGNLLDIILDSNFTPLK